MKNVIRKFLRFGITLALGIALVHFLYKNIDVNMVRNILKHDVNYWWLIPAGLLGVFSNVFRAFRWQLQLNVLNIRATFHTLLCSYFGTYFVNLLFPRLGEVWRTEFIAQRQKAHFTTVFGSMIADRLSDTLTVVLLTVFTFFLAKDAFYDFLNTYPELKADMIKMVESPWLYLSVAAIVLAFVALFRSKSQNPMVLKVRNSVLNLWEGLSGIAKMPNKWKFLLYTAGIWLCYYFELYVFSLAFDFTTNLGYVPVLVLFVLSSIGMGVPTNGGLGAWHVGIIFGLSVYGVGQFTPPHFDTHASAFAMFVWCFQQAVIIICGIYALTYNFYYDKMHQKHKE